MDESRVSFGAWVARLRRAQDLTQQELAARAGCSVSALRKIESDERRPSREIAALLAQALGVPGDQQTLFLRVARRELMVERLPAPEVVAAAAFTAGHTRPENARAAAVRAEADLPFAAPHAPVTPDLTPPDARSAATLPPLPAPTPLPQPSTPLVGRDAELATVQGLFAEPGCRMVTLIGPGGIGKTRLALQAAAQLQASENAPLYFVALTSLQSTPAHADPAQAMEQLAQTLAVTVGAPLEGAACKEDQLAAWLAPRSLTLVLDSMEYLLDGADLLALLLAQAPGLRLLVTSRERLNLHGEWVLEVRGLPAPPLPSPLQPAETGAQVEAYSAVQLFLHSAQRARVGFLPSSEELVAIARICRLVDGLPLALELAAGWVRILSCAEIADEIERDLHFLSSQARDVPARHRSMTTLFEQSWALLEERERQALSRLAIFRGGFTREMAAEVAGASLPVLSSLVARSLVRRSSEQRYDLHELVRQFALERLRAGGAAHATERALVMAMRTLVRTARPAMIGPEQMRWLDRVAVEQDNLRAALDWCTQAGEIAIGLEIATAMTSYWYQRDVQREGLRRLGALLDAADRLPGDPATPRAAGSEPLEPHILVDALHGFAYLAYEVSEFVLARRRIDEGLEILAQVPSPHLEVGLLNTLGQVLAGMGDLEAARTVLERTLALAPDDGYAERRRGVALMALADVHSLTGEDARAQFLYAASASVWRESGDMNALAYAERKWGWSALRSGDLVEAERLAADSLRLNLRTESRIGILASIVCLGAVRVAKGDVEHGARLLFAAEGLLEGAFIRLRPGDQLGQIDAMAAARAQLGDAAAGLARAARTLPLEDVIALALG